MELDTLFGGAVAQRLAVSLALHKRLAPRLSADHQVNHLLREMMRRAQALSNHMGAMRLAPLCIRCASQPAGGCCSLMMAGETDAVQMLMNLMADIDVRQVRDDGRECCFLGEEGCIFLFKPMFCLNYNCTHIHRAAPQTQMEKLERLAGSLLSKQYELEQLLLTIIRRTC